MHTVALSLYHFLNAMPLFFEHFSRVISVVFAMFLSLCFIFTCYLEWTSLSKFSPCLYGIMKELRREKMNIVKRTNVTEKERQQLLAITRDCHQLDGSYRTPYLE